MNFRSYKIWSLYNFSISPGTVKAIDTILSKIQLRVLPYEIKHYLYTNEFSFDLLNFPNIL